MASPLHLLIEDEPFRQAVTLLDAGDARLDLRDTVHHGTPLDWAEFAGRSEIADYLRSRTA